MSERQSSQNLSPVSPSGDAEYDAHLRLSAGQLVLNSNAGQNLSPVSPSGDAEYDAHLRLSAGRLVLNSIEGYSRLPCGGLDDTDRTDPLSGVSAESEPTLQGVVGSSSGHQ